MTNDRIERALAALPGLLLQGDGHGARALLEELYDAAQDDLMRDLCGAKQAAARWGVTERRAVAHITRLHEKHGVGARIGTVWVIRRAHVEAHPPDAKYRRKADTTNVGAEALERTGP